MPGLRRTLPAARFAALVAAMFVCAPAAAMSHGRGAGDPAVTHADTARELGGPRAAHAVRAAAAVDGEAARTEASRRQPAVRRIGPRRPLLVSLR